MFVPKLDGLACLTSDRDIDPVLAFGSAINEHLVFMPKLDGLACLTSERDIDPVLAFGSTVAAPSTNILCLCEEHRCKGKLDVLSVDLVPRFNELASLAFVRGFCTYTFSTLPFLEHCTASTLARFHVSA